jgi:hypothetical protein
MQTYSPRKRVLFALLTIPCAVAASASMFMMVVLQGLHLVLKGYPLPEEREYRCEVCGGTDCGYAENAHGERQSHCVSQAAYSCHCFESKH